MNLGDVAVGLYFLFMFWPGVSYAVRRLHDMNMSGFWLLLVWFPLIPLMMLFRNGTPGSNDYGPEP